MRYYEIFKELVEELELLHGIAPEVAAKILKAGLTKVYDAGEYIFHKGDEGDQMYVILSGEVAISDEGQPIAILRKGELFGEMAIFGDHQRCADAVAKSTCELFILNDTTLDKLMQYKEGNRMLLNIIATLSARLCLANRPKEESQ